MLLGKTNVLGLQAGGQAQQRVVAAQASQLGVMEAVQLQQVFLAGVAAGLHPALARVEAAALAQLGQGLVEGALHGALALALLLGAPPAQPSATATTSLKRRTLPLPA